MEEKCFICNELMQMSDLAEPVYLAGKQGAYMFFVCDKCFVSRNIPMMKRNQSPLKQLTVKDGKVSVITSNGKQLTMSFDEFINSLKGV